MASTSKLLVTLTVLFLFLLPVFISRVAASSEEEATLAITQAEETLASAYEAVLEAEQARANVSRLVDQMNIAGEHLAEAYMLNRTGYFDGAVRFADNSSKIGEEVRSQAEELRIEAYGSWITSLSIRITSSIAGVFAAVSGTYIAWWIFKRRYPRQV